MSADEPAPTGTGASSGNPRDHAHHPAHVPGHEATDSAGTPWQGRHLGPTGFETDTGAADPALLAAVADGDDVSLMRALEAARLIVPIVAEPTGVDDSGPLAVETSVDMAAVTLVAPDGQRALPVFTGVEALAAWDAAARPVPVTPLKVGQAAVSEGCSYVVVDVAGPVQRELRPSMVFALAQARPWQPAHDDPVVAQRVAAAVAGESEVSGYAVEEGTPYGTGTLGVVLTLQRGLAPEAVRAVATRVGERLAQDVDLRVRVDGLAFRLV